MVEHNSQDPKMLHQAIMPPRAEWRRRWLLIRCVLVFCATLVLFITVCGGENQIREAIAVSAFSLAGAVILGYLGFATQDDIQWMRARKSTSAP
jgi:archaellum biogenesis protein FlaJ (TadC family)